MTKPTEHFNSAAETWDSEETIHRTSVFAAAIKKHLIDHKINNLLDFGCGTGLLTEHFLDSSSSLTGIDTSVGMLEKFNRRFQHQDHVKSLAGNVEDESMSEIDESYDVIMSSMAFHHLKDPKKVLKLFKKYLAPNGKIFIIDLDEEDGTFHPDNKGMGVEHFGFSQKEFQTWANELGFKKFSYEIVFEMNKNQRSYGIGLAIFEDSK